METTLLCGYIVTTTEIQVLCDLDISDNILACFSTNMLPFTTLAILPRALVI